ncbi:hypothetical protein D9M68_850570 [compost metagenome]
MQQARVFGHFQRGGVELAVDLLSRQLPAHFGRRRHQSLAITAGHLDLGQQEGGDVEVAGDVSGLARRVVAPGYVSFALLLHLAHGVLGHFTDHA